jgi:hypothetical protein
MSSCCTGTLLQGVERPIQTEGREQRAFTNYIQYMDDNAHDKLDRRPFKKSNLKEHHPMKSTKPFYAA